MSHFSRKRKIMLCMNSCSAMILSKCLLMIFKTLPIYALAKANETTLLIRRGVFDLNIPDTYWSSDLVIQFYSTPPAICLITAILSLIMIKSISLFNTFLHLVILWVFLISWIDLCLSIFSGLITREGLGYVAQYLYLPDTMYLIGAILALMVLPLGAFFIISTIDELQKQTCPEILYLRDNSFITPTITIPAIIYSLIAFLAYNKFEFVNIMGNQFLLLGVLPIILSRGYYSAPYAVLKDQRDISLTSLYIISLLGLVAIVLINRNDLRL